MPNQPRPSQVRTEQQADKPVRPSEAMARATVEAFLETELPGYPTYSLCHDGDTGWAFWVSPDDTTSYLRHDLSVQWQGSGWPEFVGYDGAKGKWVDMPVSA